ncbi:MAG: acyl-CoA dehydrogenase family protein [Gammaproteobacteria bacterium]|nr:acyl-CoA dehydrogenase family protein [Gammaproteobacteria bacterium]
MCAESHGVGRTPDQGMTMVGPLLIQHGSAEQKAHYLPKILAGEHIWCQGYSEPGAGSDLASLRTSALRDGDHYVVNGHKLWTTLAMDANMIFMLVRTQNRQEAGRHHLSAGAPETPASRCGRSSISACTTSSPKCSSTMCGAGRQCGGRREQRLDHRQGAARP